MQKLISYKIGRGASVMGAMKLKSVMSLSLLKIMRELIDNRKITLST